METADGFEDRPDAAAQLVVMTIVEALEVDLVEVNPGPQVFEHMGRAIAIRDKSGKQAGGFRLFEYGYGPLAGDEWLIVGTDRSEERRVGKQCECRGYVSERTEVTERRC